MEQFQIYFNGLIVTVRVDHEYNEVTNDPVFFVDLPDKTLYIEMDANGIWQECEGETSPLIQCLGELIEEHDW